MPENAGEQILYISNSVQPEMGAKRPAIQLTEEQKQRVRQITLGVKEVDEEVRQTSQEDVIDTLENGHPLNRLIANPNGDLIGYIACEDFVPGEAYIKYFASTGDTGLNLMREIPAFLDYAKEQGYQKLNFHGWNKRLNHILKRYGFERIRTDSNGSLQADFYEKILSKPKSSKQIAEAHHKSFETKLIQKFNQDYQRILESFSTEDRETKEQLITNTFQNLSHRLEEQNGFLFTDFQKTVLKLKLARHFQKNQNLDLNSIFDAIIETPNFINNDRGSLNRLLEVHQQKTLKKITENRKRQIENTDNPDINPENLYTTKSGKYYLCRLLNKSQLEKESDYMDHCVGTSDSYINLIKKGEAEIFSFRKVGDGAPLLTIEYDLKTGTIIQLKKKSDEYLTSADPFVQDVFEALKYLRETTTDTGKSRIIRKFESSELNNFKVKPGYLLTDEGIVHFRDLNLKENPLILKTEKIEITADISHSDAAKLIQIFDGIKINPKEIARTPQEIKSSTRVYVGPLFKNIFKDYQSLENIYTSFPEGKVRCEPQEAGGKPVKNLEHELKVENKINVGTYAEQMMNKPDFVTLKSRQTFKLVYLKVSDLGFDHNPTTTELYEKAEYFGLDLCPPEIGPELRFKYKDQPLNEWKYIAMKPITDSDDDPYVFKLGRNDGGLWLDSYWAYPDRYWDLDDEMVFCLRK
jgi:hypothetical protein